MNEDPKKPEDTPKTILPVITSLEMAASDLHEMYLSLVWAGFNEKQALYIIGISVSGGMLSPYNADSAEDDFEDESVAFDDLDDEEDF
jgi:hypothetical protein